MDENSFGLPACQCMSGPKILFCFVKLPAHTPQTQDRTKRNGLDWVGSAWLGSHRKRNGRETVKHLAQNYYFIPIQKRMNDFYWYGNGDINIEACVVPIDLVPCHTQWLRGWACFGFLLLLCVCLRNSISVCIFPFSSSSYYLHAKIKSYAIYSQHFRNDFQFRFAHVFVCLRLFFFFFFFFSVFFVLKILNINMN